MISKEEAEQIQKYLTIAYVNLCRISKILKEGEDNGK
jgi:hypothetical protein